MTEKAHNYYLSVWYRVRAALNVRGTAAQMKEVRHMLHEEALGYRKSSKAFTNKEFDRVLDLFYSLYKRGYKRKYTAPLRRPSVTAGNHVPDAEPTKYHNIPAADDPGERKRLCFSIEQMYPRDRSGGLNSYIEVILQGIFQGRKYESLSVADLTHLRDTCANRKRAQRQRDREEAAAPQQPELVPVQSNSENPF